MLKPARRFTSPLRSLLLGMSLFSGTNSFATDYSDLSAYEFEIIIFAFNQTRSAGSEIWPDLVKTAPVENAIDLHDNANFSELPGPEKMAYYYSKLPADKFQLNNELEKLEKSNEVSVLYHEGWIQPGLDKDKAEFIHIQVNGQNQDLSIIDPLNTISGNVPTQPVMINHSAAQNDGPVLDGVIKVELGRYLHIYFDLKYQRNLGPQEGVLNNNGQQISDIKYYPVQTHRRMRSKEVHYIDHPLIGILVLATPFENPLTATPETITAPLMRLQDTPTKR